MGEFKVGDKVTLVSYNRNEHGIIKSIPDYRYVFVVYNCGGDWDHYQDYTAARTELANLVPGWVGDAIDRNAERNMPAVEKVLGGEGHCRLCGVRLIAENTPHPSDGKFCGLCSAVRDQWQRTHAGGSGGVEDVNRIAQQSPVPKPDMVSEDRPRKINWRGNE